MKVYVDDMLIKSAQEIDNVKDLEEAFDALHHHQMKLDPSKCAFSMIARKFLEFIVTR